MCETEKLPERTSDPYGKPWVAGLSILVCVGVFVGIAAHDDSTSWETLAKFGYLPADSIWSGGLHALVTSAFVHLALWHLAFNVYWLWTLGRRLEGAIGSLRFLAFIVLTAFVSSSFELAVSDDTGVGASGVVYAIFGYMWATRDRHPGFREIVDNRAVLIFVVWLIGCLVATRLGVWAVGNAAHFSGLLLGGLVAGAFALRFRRRAMLAALLLLITLSAIPLFWCPWSVTWLGRRAYAAHVAEEYGEAIEHYSRIIRLDPDNSWAYFNRGSAHQARGDSELAEKDFEAARRIDPSFVVEE